MEKEIKYKCSQCGATITIEKGVFHKRCPYCNGLVGRLRKEIEEYKIKYIIPFEIDEKKAREIAVDEWNKIFGKRPVISKVEKKYVPCYLCDCELDSIVRYTTTKKIINKVVYHDYEQLLDGVINDLIVPMQEERKHLRNLDLIDLSGKKDADVKMLGTTEVTSGSFINLEEILGKKTSVITTKIIKRSINKLYSINSNNLVITDKKTENILIPIYQITFFGKKTFDVVAVKMKNELSSDNKIAINQRRRLSILTTMMMIIIIPLIYKYLNILTVFPSVCAISTLSYFICRVTNKMFDKKNDKEDSSLFVKIEKKK